jgi:hypothetical protein
VPDGWAGIVSLVAVDRIHLGDELQVDAEAGQRLQDAPLR